MDEIYDVPKKYFLLCIQTKLQRDIMKQFGNDVICIDATRNTNICNFLLITIMLIDSYGEGVPVAWAISSNEDSCTLTQLFKPLYERVGKIKPKLRSLTVKIEV